MDLVGLMGPEDRELFENPLSEPRMEWLAAHVPPAGRGAHPLEKMADISTTVHSEEAIGAYLALASLARAGTDRPITRSLEHTMLRWDARRTPTTAAEALLINIVEMDLCGRDFARTIARVLLVSDDHVRSKLGVSLFLMCRRSTKSIERAHLEFARSLRLPRAEFFRTRFLEEWDVPGIFVDSMFNEWLGDLELSVSLTEAATVFVARNNALIKAKIHDRLLPAPCSTSSGTSEVVMRGLGRIMGLAIRKGEPLSDLRLSLSVIAALHKDCWNLLSIESVSRELGIEAQDTRWIVISFFEPIFHISRGIRDVVGPAGPQVLSCEAWMALFAVPATAAPEGAAFKKQRV